MKVVLFAVVLLGMMAFALGACVAPPADLSVCPMEPGTRVPQEYATVEKDRQLAAYLAFLDSINQRPGKKCLEAYLEFACSEAYPRCNGDANSGLSYRVNTCYYQCANFVRRCENELIGVPRPDCGTYSVTEDCTGRQLQITNGASSLGMGAMLMALMATLVVLL